ncbi:MAG TPA: tetratricopeptide repeat protein, partial [Leptospiraceae bacterium]|nr:tetratricopeptide repeat protein [Leptospiraceae bacterium]
IGYRESGGVPEALIESPVNKEIRDLLVKSGELTRAQNFAGAVPLLEQAFKLDDRHPEVIKRLALAYVNLKMFDKAAPLAEDYTYLRPGDSEFVYVASYCLKKVKEYSRAADYGERLKLRNPRHVKNLINLAEVYAKMRNLARAELLLDSALLVDPDNTTARSRLEKVRRAA